MDEPKTPRQPPFKSEGTAELPDHPALLGGECAACGYVFFPMQNYGCERCGSVDLNPRDLTGSAEVMTRAKVHEHRGPGLEAPFTVAAVHLEDGPVIRALLDQETADATEIGDRVVTKLIPETRPDRGEYDIRFTKESQ